jgi:hypothetical protein
VNFRRAIEKVVGVVEIDDDLVERCRRNVKARCETIDCAKYKRLQAQEALSAEAKLAIVDTFSEGTDRHFRVGASWPGAWTTIKGDRAFIDIDIGIDTRSDGEGVEVIEIDVFRSRKNATGLGAIMGMFSKKAEPPPMQLTEKVGVPEKPKPAPASSKARSILNADRKR